MHDTKTWGGAALAPGYDEGRPSAKEIILKDSPEGEGFKPIARISR